MSPIRLCRGLRNYKGITAGPSRMQGLTARDAREGWAGSNPKFQDLPLGGLAVTIPTTTPRRIAFTNAKWDQ